MENSIHLARFVAMNAAYSFNVPVKDREEFKSYFVELWEKSNKLVWADSVQLEAIVNVYKLLKKSNLI